MSNDQGVFKWDANNRSAIGGFSADGKAITAEYVDADGDGLGEQKVSISSIGSDASGNVKTLEIYSPNNNQYGVLKTYSEYLGTDINGVPKKPLMIDVDGDGIGEQAVYVSSLGTDVSGNVKTLEMYSPDNNDYGLLKTYSQYLGEDINGVPKKPLMYDVDGDDRGELAVRVASFGTDASGNVKTSEMYSPNNNNYGNLKVFAEYMGEDVDGVPKKPLMYDPDGNGRAALTTYVKDFDISLKTVFNRLKTSNPYTLTDIINRYDISPEIWTTATATGGSLTHLGNESSIQLSCTATTNSAASMTTINNFRYQAGKSHVITLTAASGNTVPGIIKRWGYYNDNDGVFFQSSGGVFQIVIRSSTSGSPVDFVVDEVDFSADKMNLESDSAFDIDIANGNIYQIEFQWLGVGIVNFYTISTNNQTRLLHQVKHANLFNQVYMATASLPVRYEIRNYGGGPISSLKAICQSVQSDGGQQPPSFYFGAGPAATVSITNVARPVLSIRPRLTFNSLRNFINIYPETCSITCTTQPIRVSFIKNATLVGAVWANADANSGTEVDTTATALSGGTLVYQAVLAINTNLQVDLSKIFGINKEFILYNNANVQETFTISAVRLGGTNGAVDVSLNWGEVR